MAEELRPSDEQAYIGKGLCWPDFLHHRARVIEWLRTEFGYDDETIATTLSMDPVQVHMIRTRNGSLDNG